MLPNKDSAVSPDAGDDNSGSLLQKKAGMDEEPVSSHNRDAKSEKKREYFVPPLHYTTLSDVNQQLLQSLLRQLVISVKEKRKYN